MSYSNHIRNTKYIVFYGPPTDPNFLIDLTFVVALSI